MQIYFYILYYLLYIVIVSNQQCVWNCVKGYTENSYFLSHPKKYCY